MTDSWLSFPIKTAVWRIRFLRLLFPRRWWVQMGKNIYIIREPR